MKAEFGFWAKKIEKEAKNSITINPWFTIFAHSVGNEDSEPRTQSLGFNSCQECQIEDWVGGFGNPQVICVEEIIIWDQNSWIWGELHHFGLSCWVLKVQSYFFPDSIHWNILLNKKMKKKWRKFGKNEENLR